MTLIKETVTRYRCPHCGYQSEREPLSGKCPACSDGEQKVWSLSTSERPQHSA
jgi:rubrerythrin